MTTPLIRCQAEIIYNYQNLKTLNYNLLNRFILSYFSGTCQRPIQFVQEKLLQYYVENRNTFNLDRTEEFRLRLSYDVKQRFGKIYSFWFKFHIFYKFIG